MKFLKFCRRSFSDCHMINIHPFICTGARSWYWHTHSPNVFVVQSRLKRREHWYMSHSTAAPPAADTDFTLPNVPNFSNASRAPKPFQPSELASILIVISLTALIVPFFLMYGNGLENNVRFTLPFHSSWFRILNAIRVVAVKLGNLFVWHRRPFHIYAGNGGTISFKGNDRCGLQRMLLRDIMK